MNSFTFPIATDHKPGGWHSAYAEVYEMLFDRFDRDAKIRLLEIGTDGGGMLRSYAEYFPKGFIYGVDISPAPANLDEVSSIKHYQMDAYEVQTVDTLSRHSFDIIVDDGPHTLESQKFFCQHYPHLLSQNGIAVVEDIAEHAHLTILQSCVGPEFFTMSIDLTHHDNQRFDNRLLAIWRR